MRVLLIVLLVLLIVPGWTGPERLALYHATPAIDAAPVRLDPADPARTRVGALTFVGGVHLTGSGRAFGGFSALTVAGARITLLSDGGNVLAFTLDRAWHLHDVAATALPAGPGIGWEKQDRDTESMTRDPATGQIWVGFEGANAIWRYAPGFAAATAHVAPAAMAKWPINGGAESLVRLRDGRFVTISEQGHVARQRWRGSDAARRHTRDGLIFAADPTVDPRPPVHFAYAIDGRYDVADMTQLPGGDLVVLERAFRLPFAFSNRLMRVRAADVRAGAIVRGHLIATLDAPLIHDNFEGIAATREAGRTMLWLVSDDNQVFLQRTLLLKFRYDG